MMSWVRAESRWGGAFGWTLSTLLLLSGVACQADPRDEVLADAARLEQAEQNAPPPGVILQVPAILGLSWSQFQGSPLEAQLGPFLEKERLPGVRGTAYHYEKGDIAVGRDEIYLVTVTFPAPISRLEALHRVGLPESILSELKESSTELRAERSSFGMRRLSIVRENPGSELFVKLSAWKFIPQERF